jgi:hypothetical protein
MSAVVSNRLKAAGIALREGDRQGRMCEPIDSRILWGVVGAGAIAGIVYARNV